MKDTAGIGSRNPAGTYEITDTAWDSNGTLRVTVRELMGLRELAPRDIAAMRRLARTALMYPEKTRSSRLIRSWYGGGCSHATFAVSRLDLR